MSKEKHLVTFIDNGGSPLLSLKPERNAPCPCGSGKKAKKCCGVEPSYRLTGKALENRKSEIEENLNKNKQW